jgi:hypothetical protein
LTYAQLGSPVVDFHSFWEVYNELRDAVDAEFLFQSSSGAFNVENLSPDLGPQAEVPLHHLRACEFGKDGIPAGQYTESEGEAAHFLIFILSP